MAIHSATKIRQKVQTTNERTKTKIINFAFDIRTINTVQRRAHLYFILISISDNLDMKQNLGHMAGRKEFITSFK